MRIMAIGIAFLCATAPLHAAEAKPPLAERAAPRTFTIVAGKDSIAGPGAYRRMAKRTAEQLIRKGYRAVVRGETPDMVVQLSYGGKTLSYRDSDANFLPTPNASSMPDGAYPYPSGPIPGTRAMKQPSRIASELSVFVAVKILGADGVTSLFENGATKRLDSRTLDNGAEKMLDAVLANFPAATS